MMSLPYCFDQEDSKEILERLCKEKNIDIKLIEDLCMVELDVEGSGRPEGVYESVKSKLDEFSLRHNSNVVSNMKSQKKQGK